jgi:xanthine dehydrogenase accessory factor
VLKEALLSMEDHQPRLVVISQDSQRPYCENTRLYNMTCQSGGEVEVYIEPVLPRPSMVIFGTSHIGRSLSRISHSMDYQVKVVANSIDKDAYPNAVSVEEIKTLAPQSINPKSYLVICTQGEGDLEALKKALESDAGYIAFVASRKKANALFSDLRKLGVTMDQLKKIQVPAGLDIGAKLPEEVAISILSQIIKHFRADSENQDETPGSEKFEISMEDYYINPVCKIPVHRSSAKHILEYKGEQVFFCCDGCKASFEKAPESYMS